MLPIIGKAVPTVWVPARELNSTVTLLQVVPMVKIAIEKVLIIRGGSGLLEPDSLASLAATVMRLVRREVIEDRVI
jgi:hypothetical protein